MTDEERCHAEQSRAAAYLADCPQGPKARGARLGLADWMMEEVLIMTIESLQKRIAELTADEEPRKAAERIALYFMVTGVGIREMLVNSMTTAIQAAVEAERERGRAKVAELEALVFDAHFRAFPYYVWTDARSAIDLLVAEVTTLRAEYLRIDHTAHVRGFMEKFDQHIGEAPGWPPQEVLESKLRRVAEEFCELIAACGYKPHVQISNQDGDWVIEEEITSRCDTVPDLPHAVREAVDLEFSTHHLMISCGVDTAEPWARVVAANMAKELRDGQPVKPEGWQAPNIAGALKEQGWQGGAE